MKIITIIIIICVSLIALFYSICPGTIEDQEVLEQSLELNRIEDAIQAYKMVYGEAPKGDKIIEQLENKNEQNKVFIKVVRNESNEIVDIWGSVLKHQSNSETFIITSAGPDKEFLTSDDIIKKIKLNL